MTRSVFYYAFYNGMFLLRIVYYYFVLRIYYDSTHFTTVCLFYYGLFYYSFVTRLYYESLHIYIFLGITRSMTWSVFYYAIYIFLGNAIVYDTGCILHISWNRSVYDTVCILLHILQWYVLRITAFYTFLGISRLSQTCTVLRQDEEEDILIVLLVVSYTNPNSS